MKKTEFINRVQFNLASFEKREVDEIVRYYDEIITDKIEAGLSEEAAIDSLGSIESITSEIKLNLVSKRSDAKDTSSLKNFLIILGICSTPILLPLGIAFTVLYFAMFIVLFAMILAFGLSGITVLISLLFQGIVTIFSSGDVWVGLTLIGVGLTVGSILIFFALYIKDITIVLLNATTKWFAKLVGKKSKKGN